MRSPDKTKAARRAPAASEIQHGNCKSTARPREFQLRETPERSDRQIAAALGVSHTTVATVRDELEGGGQIGHLNETTGADGKTYPRPRANGKADSAEGEPTWARSLRALYGPPKVPFPRRRT
jgi:hypothetical protein